MTAEIITLKHHKPVNEARQYINEALRMVREGGHQPQTIDLLLSKAHDILYDYVETSREQAELHPH